MYEFEIRIRNLIINPEENFEQIIKAFSECYKEKDYGRNPLLVI